MSLKTIYVTRHGFRSNWHVDHTTGVYTAHIPSPTGIAADPALTSHGVDQAEELARHLDSLEPPIDAVYSSPYYRCLQTIQPYARLRRGAARDGAGAGAGIYPEHGLCEWFGAAPFEHPRPAPGRVLKGMFPEYDERYVSALTPSTRGETVAQLYQRVSGAVQAIIDRSNAQGARSVVLCTHAAVVIVLGRVLTGQVPDAVDHDDFRAFTCGLNVFQCKDDDNGPYQNGLGRWACEVNGECSFLSNGQERGWMFSGDESFPGTGSLSQDAQSEAKL